MRFLSRSLSLQDMTLMYLTTLATLVVILMASYQAGSAADSRFPYRILLDPRGDLMLSWNVSYPQQELYLELRVSHLRYGVVLGMSDRGEVFNADLIILWNDGQKSYFGDAWSDSNGHVTLDSQQDYQLIETRHTTDGFYLLFKRPFSTCDSRDYLIEEGTVHFIYAMLEEPLRSVQQLNLSLLHPGVQRVLLLRPESPTPPLPHDVRTLEVLAPGITIPDQETTYWCYMYQLPPDIPKNHIVMYEAVITPGNEAIVHHMEVFECAPQMENIPQYSGSCESKMKPKKLNYCRHVLAAWALGAEAFYYPPDAGLALGGPGSSRFLRLEVHYHNPLLISGRRDSSGIRLFYTPTLRKYDAGIMELGLVYTPVMAIPPAEKDFLLTGYCTSKCTQTALPPGGINIFASQLHTHLAGHKVRTVLVRGGREMEIVQEDKHYSAHYQVHTQESSARIKHQYLLLTQCVYNTEDRNLATVGGFGIMEEMCVNYVHYYPRTQLELCKSHVDPGYLQKYFTFINRFQGGDSCNCGQPSVTEQFMSMAWDSFSSQVLSSLYSTAPISMHCNQSTAELFPGDWEKQELPQITTFLPKHQYLCESCPWTDGHSGSPTVVQPHGD
ncbi:dopamine beta-hydroxylase [Arapaima gigas]